MKILIAGGEGYLGSTICNQLLSKHTITSVDIGWFGTDLPLNIEKINKDIFDLKTEDLTFFEAIIFVAGLSNDPMSEFDPKSSFSQNTGSLFYLAKLAKEAGCKRFICASSASVYGWEENIVNEQTIPRTQTYYGMSKYLGEIALKQLEDENFSVCIFRMGTLGGHSSRMRFDLVINTMFRSIKKDNKIILHDPDIWRPILDVRDAARAFEFAINSEIPLQGIYNLAFDNYQVKNLAEIWQDLIQCEIEIQFKKDIRNYKLDTNAIKLKGFNFLYSAADTCKDLMLKNYSDLDSDIYFNIKTYRKLYEKK